MGEILPFSAAKCCFRFDLVIGCAVYVTVEVYLWAILMLASIYSEVKMAQNNDIAAFKNFTKSSSYYVTAFGNPADGLGRGVLGELKAQKNFLSRKKLAEEDKFPPEQENRFFPFFFSFRSHSNRRQRFFRCRFRALLCVLCDSPNWHIGGENSRE